MENLLLQLAASLLSLLALVHSVLGERYIIRRLIKIPLPKLLGSDWFTKQTLRFAWHITSVAWVGIAAVLVASPHAHTVKIVGLLFLISSLFPLIATRGKHFSWVFFLIIGGLCLAGLVT